MRDKQWNFLVITTDEERYPPLYDKDLAAKFRAEHLSGQIALRENSIEFHRH